MKLFLVLVSALAVSNAAISSEFKAAFMEKMQNIGEICLPETGANDDDVAELLSHKIPPTSHEAKCMIFCFHKNFHIQNPDGTIDHEGAVNSLEPIKAEDPEIYEKMRGVFMTCGSKAVIDADPCITATNLATCAFEESTKVGLKEDFMEV